MIRKRPLVLAIALAGCVTACSILEDYQFGDVTRAALTTAEKVNALKADYCATPNGPARDVLLRTIRRADPDYVGVCVVVAP